MSGRSNQRVSKTSHEANAPQSTIWIAAIALAIATLAAYARALGCDFIWFDDNEYVTTNSLVLQGLTLDNIRWAFTTYTLANWHPLTWLSHMLDVELWGSRAAGHHLTNTLLHAANTALLLVLMRQMTGALWRSALVAALFALHPLHVESVAWVSERKDVLSTFFGLLAIFAYVHYVRRPSFLNYSIIVCVFALSLMTKPMLVTLPFVLLLLDYWPLQRKVQSPKDQNPKHTNLDVGYLNFGLLFEKVPLLMMSIASSIITIIAQKTGGAVVPIEAMTLDQRIVNATVTYAMYLWKTVWPVDLAVFYPMQREISAAVVIGSVLTLGVISAIAIAQSRKRPALIVGWLWYLGTLVPVIGLVQVGFQSMADRYTYVPLIGIFIMIAWAIPEVSVKTARAYAAGCAAILIVLAVRTWHQLGYWRDTHTLMNHAIDVTDNNFIAHTILGYALSRDGNAHDAERHYRLAVEMNPKYGVAHDNLGTALLSQRRFDEAISHLQQAVQLQPRAASTRNNLGAALMDSGDLDGAIAAFHEAIDLDHHFAHARLNLGRALAAKQQFPQAIEQYILALEQEPNWPEAHVHLGIAQASIGQLDDAIANFERALKLKPDNALARECLTMARQQRDQQQPK